MLVSQMIACHAASLECHRRAMLPDQTVEARQINLSAASKLSRTYAALLEALNRHRGKGQQVVRVEHVTVQAGGQAIVGAVTQGGGGHAGNRGSSPCTGQPLPMHQSPRCGARTRRGSPCRSPAVKGRRRCRMHGGAAGSGAQAGNRNALKHGRYTRELLEFRRMRARAAARECREARAGLGRQDFRTISGYPVRDAKGSCLDARPEFLTGAFQPPPGGYIQRAFPALLMPWSRSIPPLCQGVGASPA